MYIKHCEKSEIVCTDLIVLFEVIKMLSFQLCLIAFFVCVCVLYWDRNTVKFVTAWQRRLVWFSKHCSKTLNLGFLKNS